MAARDSKASLKAGWRPKSVVNLKPLQGTPQYAPAKARNFGYITSCRDEACAELATAATAQSSYAPMDRRGVLLAFTVPCGATSL
eukprot:7340681-Prymnesium_polylepis.1